VIINVSLAAGRHTQGGGNVRFVRQLTGTSN
jgi:hypothetical protein